MIPVSSEGIFLAFLYCIGVISIVDQGFGVSAAGDCSRCGIGKLPEKFLIRDGVPVSDTTFFPWMAKLSLDDRLACGGMIISDRFILTAGHCIVEKNLRHKMKVHFQTESPKKMTRPYDIEKFIVHSQYGFVVSPAKKVAFAKYDVALLKLKEKIKCNAFINPICLPDAKFKLPVGQKTLIMGWGRPDPKQLELDVLNYASLKNLNYQECIKEIPELQQVRNQMLCLGGTKQTACFGDSGGPMVHNIGNKFYAIGIASSVTDLECKVSGKVMYSNVMAFADWIKKVIRKH